MADKTIEISIGRTGDCFSYQMDIAPSDGRSYKALLTLYTVDGKTTFDQREKLMNTSFIDATNHQRTLKALKLCLTALSEMAKKNTNAKLNMAVFKIVTPTGSTVYVSQLPNASFIDRHHLISRMPTYNEQAEKEGVQFNHGPPPTAMTIYFELIER